MYNNTAKADMEMEVLIQIHKKLPVGVAATKEDMAIARDIVYTNAVLDTIRWKLDNGIKLMWQ